MLALAGAQVCLAAVNTLSADEQRDGWILLFNGKTMAGYVDTTQKHPP